MADPNVRQDSVNVVQIMEQIRARIRETRGAEYTDDQIRELASATLQRYLDPRGVRPELVEQLRRAQSPAAVRDLPHFEFEEDTIFESTRPILRWIRSMLRPILKLFFNPNPLIRALNIQARLNAGIAEREASRDATRYAFDQLHYEAMHNIVIEMTRLGVEMKHLRMQLESLTGRLEFTERRARSVETAMAQVLPATERAPVFEYKPEPAPPVRHAPASEERTPEVPAGAPAPAPAGPQDARATRSRRRRRRRGRRGSAGAQATEPGGQPTDQTDTDMEGDGADLEGGESDVQAGPALDAPADGRTARPEPFEHTFGAQAHPAESAASDPTSRDTHRADPTRASEPNTVTLPQTPES